TALSPKAVRILATSQTLDEILANRTPERSLGSGLKLYAAFTEEFAPAELRAVFREHALAEQAMAEFEEKLPTVMVMEEMPESRETHVLLRGQYDKPGERVEPTTPAQLPHMSIDAQPNRLGLAQWLVDRANPLTSRVFVNRIWQLQFGTGIVKTSEDF